MTMRNWVLSLGSSILGLALFSVAGEAATSSPPPAAPTDSPASYSAAALYNLGNTYAREGKSALAVLNYERAHILAPRDPDLEANLQQVRDSASLPPAASGVVDHWRLMSPNAAYWLGVTGLLIAGLSGVLLALKKVPRVVSLRVALAAGLLTVGYTLVDSALTAHVLREGVVMQSVAASASPIANAETLFTVPSATVVRIQDEHGNFWLIRDPRGNVGWAPRSSITPLIDPRGDFHA